jgi:myo-inositol catabolism protein IolC
MALGYDKSLYILAFDHRGSFQKKMFGITEEPTPEQTDTISDAKRVIYEGWLRALDEGVPKESAGILVDEQFGGDVAREAAKEGLLFAMPVEKSGQDEFDFEYGDDFDAHIEEFNPRFTKVLVRYNPEGEKEMNDRQLGRLKRLSDWLHANDRKFLFELLVPAEESQLEAVDGDSDRYDKELRPALMRDAITAIQAGGAEPDIWKIEGLDQRADCEKTATLARSNGRDGVACVVLGRGADDDAVDHWLRQGAPVDGYVGFAIGRSIWWDALKGYIEGGLARDVAAAQIATNYRRFIDVYESAQ